MLRGLGTFEGRVFHQKPSLAPARWKFAVASPSEHFLFIALTHRFRVVDARLASGQKPISAISSFVPYLMDLIRCK
jgi:hypothetical protein